MNLSQEIIGRLMQAPEKDSAIQTYLDGFFGTTTVATFSKPVVRYGATPDRKVIAFLCSGIPDLGVYLMGRTGHRAFYDQIEAARTKWAQLLVPQPDHAALVQILRLGSGL